METAAGWDPLVKGGVLFELLRVFSSEGDNDVAALPSPAPRVGSTRLPSRVTRLAPPLPAPSTGSLPIAISRQHSSPGAPGCGSTHYNLDITSRLHATVCTYPRHCECSVDPNKALAGSIAVPVFRCIPSCRGPTPTFDRLQLVFNLPQPGPLTTFELRTCAGIHQYSAQT